MSDTVIDPDNLNDEEFIAYKDEMSKADGPLPEDAPKEEPPAKEEKAVDPDADDDDDGDEPSTDDGKQKTVPHGRLHRERERRKEAEAKLADFSRKQEILEQRTAEILQMQVRAQQPQQQRQPTYEERAHQLRADGDFIGLQELQDQQIREMRAQQDQIAQQTHHQRQAQEFEQRVVSAVKENFQSAVTSDPTNSDMYEFMWNTAVKQLVEVEGLPVEEATNRAKRFELQFYAEELQKGRNPILTMRKIAEMRGWKPQQQGDEQGALEAATAEIDRLNKAKSAARTLSGAGSEPRTGVPSPKDIADMSDNEFRAFKEKYGDDGMRLAMGG